MSFKSKYHLSYALFKQILKVGLSKYKTNGKVYMSKIRNDSFKVILTY